MPRANSYFIIGVDEGLSLEGEMPDEYKKVRKTEAKEIKYIGFKPSDVPLLKDLIRRGLLLEGRRDNLNCSVIFVGRSMEVVTQYQDLFGLDRVDIIAEVETQLLPAIKLYWELFEESERYFLDRGWLYEHRFHNATKGNKRKFRSMMTENYRVAKIIGDRKFLADARRLIRQVVKVRYLRPAVQEHSSD